MENDLDLARHASPYYLNLPESVLRELPGHAALSISLLPFLSTLLPSLLGAQ